jgi:hypothetical protein
MKHVTLMIATLISAFRQLDCRPPFFDPRSECSDAIDNDAAFAAAPSADIASPYVSIPKSIAGIPRAADGEARNGACGTKLPI